jgi:hypothetical protein
MLPDMGGDWVGPPPVLGVKVDTEGDGRKGMQQAAEGTTDESGHERGQWSPAPPGEAGPPDTEHHHALEADVDDAGPLADQAAEAGQGDGEGEPHHRIDGARRGEDALTRDDPGDREGDQSEAGEEQQAVASSAPGDGRGSGR